MHQYGINANRLGLAGAIVSGIATFIFVLIALYTNFGADYLVTYKGIMPGFELSIMGGILAGVYAFISTYVWLFLLAFVYNLLGTSQKQD